MSRCVHCDADNAECWCYCRSCGKRASVSKFGTNLWMRTERGKRTDIEFRTQTMDESVNEMNKERNIGYGR